MFNLIKSQRFIINILFYFPVQKTYKDIFICLKLQIFDRKKTESCQDLNQLVKPKIVFSKENSNQSISIQNTFNS